MTHLAKRIWTALGYHRRPAAGTPRPPGTTWQGPGHAPATVYGFTFSFVPEARQLLVSLLSITWNVSSAHASKK